MEFVSEDEVTGGGTRNWRDKDGVPEADTTRKTTVREGGVQVY